MIYASLSKNLLQRFIDIIIMMFEIVITLEVLDIASMKYCSLNHTTHQIPSSHVTLMILDKSVDWIYALWLQNHRP